MKCSKCGAFGYGKSVWPDELVYDTDEGLVIYRRVDEKVKV